MEIETKVISIETIKPSSPTPKSLQKHQLSFLDQCLHASFSPLAFFYSSNPQIPNSQKSNHLKKSLSETLSRFYPLAGRLVGNLYVDCNDAGVPFSEAEADCNVSQLITNPNPKILKNCLPYHETDEFQDVCVAVRTTYFRCGGLAVGILLSHKIADASSFLFFVNTWSAVARKGGAGGAPLPKFDSATYSPPLDIPGVGVGVQPTTGILEEEEVVSRIFTFPASEIAALRDRYAAGGRRPSRVEALSTFIWTRFVSATGIRSDPSGICVVLNAVNLRSRADPPLAGYHFGNWAVSSKAEVATGDGGVELLQKVREASKAFDAGYVARLKNSEMHLKDIIKAHARANKNVVVRFVFASLCGFPLYEADFGWGRPDWVGHGGFPYKNLVFFMDTKNGDGIEAYIQLTKQHMEKFEALLMLKSNL